LLTPPAAEQPEATGVLTEAKMRCHHCHSDMLQTEAVEDGGVRQTWFHCPVCTADHTVVQPCDNPIQRLGNLLRCRCGTNAKPWPPALLR
jgi:hypothetical protein